MQIIKSTLETEAIFSDDKQHRYLLKKAWDKEKKIVTVITMYPHYDGVLNIDLTTQLIINKVTEKEMILGILEDIEILYKGKFEFEEYETLQETRIRTMKMFYNLSVIFHNLWW